MSPTNAVPEWFVHPVLSPAGQAARAEGPLPPLPMPEPPWGTPPTRRNRPRPPAAEWGGEEAPLLASILRGRSPDVDPATWAAFRTLVEAAAARRVGNVAGDERVAAALRQYPTEVQRRRFGGHGDRERWIAHGSARCPVAPCVGLECPARSGFRGREVDELVA